MTVKPEDCASVHLAHLPKVDPAIDYADQEANGRNLMGLRDEALRVLEGLRRRQDHRQQPGSLRHNALHARGRRGAEGIRPGPVRRLVHRQRGQAGGRRRQTTVTAEKSPYPKCQRCWNYWPSVGTDAEYPDICERCAAVVKGHRSGGVPWPFVGRAVHTILHRMRRRRVTVARRRCAQTLQAPSVGADPEHSDSANAVAVVRTVPRPRVKYLQPTAYRLQPPIARRPWRRPRRA